MGGWERTMRAPATGKKRALLLVARRKSFGAVLIFPSKIAQEGSALRLLPLLPLRLHRLRPLPLLPLRPPQLQQEEIQEGGPQEVGPQEEDAVVRHAPMLACVAASGVTVAPRQLIAMGSRHGRRLGVVEVPVLPPHQPGGPQEGGPQEEDAVVRHAPMLACVAASGVSVAARQLIAMRNRHGSLQGAEVPALPPQQTQARPHQPLLVEARTALHGHAQSRKLPARTTVGPVAT